MAKNAWENSLSDQELAAMGAGRSGRGASVGRWILWLFVIGGLTLAGAYYLPLYRAHKELTQSYGTLSSNSKNIEQTLSQAADRARRHSRRARKSSRRASPARARRKRPPRIG